MGAMDGGRLHGWRLAHGIAIYGPGLKCFPRGRCLNTGLAHQKHGKWGGRPRCGKPGVNSAIFRFTRESFPPEIAAGSEIALLFITHS